MELDEQIDNLECCVANMGWQTAHNSLLGIKDEECENKFILANEKFKIVRDYIPIGTITALSLTIDIDDLGLAYPNSFSWALVSGGSVIASGTGTYATITAFILAIILAIQSGTAGYSVTQNGTVLTIVPPTPLVPSLIGQTLTVTLNAFFQKDAGENTTLQGKGSCVVNDPTSACNGYTFIANYTSDSVSVYNYDIFVATIAFPVNSQPNDCEYDPVTNSVYVPCINLAATRIIDCSTSPPTLTGTVLATGASSSNVVYNPVNQCKYVSAPGSNQVVRIDASNTLVIIPGTIGATTMAVNEYNGEVWVISSILAVVIGWIINPDTNVIVDTFPSNYQYTLAFYPGIGSSYGRMFIGDYSGQRVQEWDLSHNVINANFISVSTNVVSVFYSRIFDKLFVGISVSTGINVYNMDGTNNTAPITIGSPVNGTGNNFNDDNEHGAVTRIVYPPVGGQDNLEFINQSFEQAEISAEFEATDTQSEEENCSTYEQVLNTVEQLQTICGCGCGEDIQDINSSNNNGQMTGVIYYGKDSDDALDAAGIQALNSTTAPNFAGTFSYPVGSEYVYFAYLTSWGTPTRFKDLIGGLDIVMDTPYSVTILSQAYTVYRSFNLLGGAQSMEVQQ